MDPFDEQDGLPTKTELRTARSSDAGAIARIYNQGIEERIATFETETRTAEERKVWLASHDEHHPVVVATIAGKVVGWGSISPISTRSCYSGVGEYSVYVSREDRGHGIGAKILEDLISKAESRGYWKLMARIFPVNEASITLAKRFGFREVGVLEKHGKLDGSWVDLVEFERLIQANID
jgi:L-amino acid N-acyltransferase YncA